ncbi:MAG: hypothetical protein PHG49_03380 [Candidatus Pacebacteria bacterium]|nr:hypothetical protein [Candidatus Paceibacterota bacterium]
MLFSSISEKSIIEFGMALAKAIPIQPEPENISRICISLLKCFLIIGIILLTQCSVSTLGINGFFDKSILQFKKST